jgi:hypothetical protein
MLKVTTFRDDAIAEVDKKQGCLLTRGVAVAEFLTPGRICALGTKTEITFTQGAIYKVYTGISIEGITSPFQLAVRPAQKMFAKGVEVKRVELGNAGEIIAYITTLENFAFVRSEFMFEISRAGTPSDAVEVTVAPGKMALSDSPPLPTVRVRETLKTAAPTPQQNKSDAERIAKWMDDAPEGKVTPVQAYQRPPYEGKAEVRNMVDGLSSNL